MPKRTGSAALCALAALAVAGCRSAPPARPGRTPPPPAAAQTLPGDELDRRALLLLMEDRKLYDPTALELMLGGTAAARRQLARSLGRIGDPRGRSLLQALLVDADLEARREAAFALGELGERDAVRSLIGTAVDDDDELGTLAVEALGKLGAPLADVRRALGALDVERGWRRLAPALFRFREPEAVDAAVAGLERSDPSVRAACAYALGREAQPEGAETLRVLVADADPYVRGWAARGLGAVGELDDLARLEPLLGDAAAGPVIQALRGGARILGRASALPPLGWGDRVRALAADPRPGVRATALEVAGAFLPHPELEVALLAALAAGEPRERELALLALAAGRAEGAAELVRTAAGAADRLMRMRAAEAAGRIGDPELVDALAALAADPEPPVRVAALEALAAGAGDSAAEVAARFLGDPDPTVRATALDVLTRHPGAPAIELAAALDATRRDELDDARLAAVRALAARAAAVAGERPAVVEALGRLIEDRDWLVRREAAAALAGLGEPRPAIGPLDLGHDLAFYRDVLAQTAGRPRVALDTERGTIVLELACPEAPRTCLSFLQLARQGFFHGLSFHRVVPDFVAQGGDPRGDGWGGPGYSLRDEINRLRYDRGAVGMALSGPDTGGSQFFVTLAAQPHLDGGFTVFGHVVAGEAVLDALRQRDRILGVRELDSDAGPRLR